MIRRPPRSTLFPTRRSSDLLWSPAAMSCMPARPTRRAVCSRPPAAIRSEEHTSELQSRLHLVCRLLLEKKKIPHLGPHRTSLQTVLSAEKQRPGYAHVRVTP